MNKPFRVRVLIFPLVLFCCLVCFFCCKKEAVKVKNQGPVCYDFMTIDSNMTFPEAAYGNYYYYNSAHKLIKHVVTSGGAVAWSDTFEYVNGNMVKSLMSLSTNSTANYYTRSEYDYTDTLPTTSRYYLGNQLIVHSTYAYDAKGELTTYAQYSDNSSLQGDPDYTRLLTYDNNGNVTQLTDGSGNVLATYQDYDNHPNLKYRMPFDFAYDPFSYFNVFSKHNPAQQTGATYTYTYNASGNISSYVTIEPGSSVLTKVSSLCK